MQLRFIDTGFNGAFTNMAIDEALAVLCREPILRIYQWKPAAISVGYNQNMTEEISMEYCKKSNIDIVRRISGGKAVFHDDELTYSFILPENTNILPQDVVESYKIIANALVISLKKIGINASIKETNEKIKTPICFNSSSWYELAANSKKISGSAQRRLEGKILQHGSILIGFDYDKNSLLFNSHNDFDNIENLKKRITSVKNELKKEIDIKKLKEALRYGFERNFNFKSVNDALSNQEILLAKKLLERKYSTDEWNYGRAVESAPLSSF